MERPEWMPETHLPNGEARNNVVCMLYRCVERACAPNARLWDRLLLSTYLSALAKFLGM